jgi:hypothetical protein
MLPRSAYITPIEKLSPRHPSGSDRAKTESYPEKFGLEEVAPSLTPNGATEMVRRLNLILVRKFLLTDSGGSSTCRFVR